MKHAIPNNNRNPILNQCSQIFLRIDMIYASRNTTRKHCCFFLAEQQQHIDFIRLHCCCCNIVKSLLLRWCRRMVYWSMKTIPIDCYLKSKEKILNSQVWSLHSNWSSIVNVSVLYFSGTSRYNWFVYVIVNIFNLFLILCCNGLVGILDNTGVRIVLNYYGLVLRIGTFLGIRVFELFEFDIDTDRCYGSVHFWANGCSNCLKLLRIGATDRYIFGHTGVRIIRIRYRYGSVLRIGTFLG